MIGLGLSLTTMRSRGIGLPLADPVTGLVATANPDRTVTLTWTDPAAGDELEIRRDGVLLDSVLLGVGTFSDPFSDVVEPPTGDYSSTYRYEPRYTLPYTYDSAGVQSGSLTYNASTGMVEGRVFDASYPTSFAVEELLTDQGTPADNRAYLQARIDAHVAAVGNVRLRLARYAADGTTKLDWSNNSPIFIPARSRTAGWIVIESETIMSGTFPRTATQRAQIGDESSCSTFYRKAGNEPTIVLKMGSSRVRFVGLEFTFHADYHPALGTSSGFGTITTSGLNGSGVEEYYYVNGSTNAADYPQDIIIDRCIAHGRLGEGYQRVWWINGKRVAVLNSLVYDIGSTNNDSQAFLATSGSGPYLLENNYFSTSNGENVMFGGGHTGAATEIPSDVQLIGSHHEFPAAWDAITGTKNLFELKVGKRVLVQGNRFSGYRGEGYGSQYLTLVIKVNTDDGADSAWGTTRDVTVRCNDFFECDGIFGIAGADSYVGSPPAYAVARVEIAHNLARPISSVTGIARGWQFGGTKNDGTYEQVLHSVAYHHNTYFYAPSQYPHGIMPAGDYADKYDDFDVRGNVHVRHASAETMSYLTMGSSGTFTNTKQNFDGMLAGGMTNLTWGSNAIVRTHADPAKMIPGDVYYADEAAAGIDASTGALLSGSPLLTGDTDGGMQGADVTLVLTATANSDTGL